MFCNNCGTKKQSREDRFCKNCGVEFKTETYNMGNSVGSGVIYNQQSRVNQSRPSQGLLNQSPLKQSISILKESTLKNINLVLIAILAIALVSNIKGIDNIPYIYVIFKVAECAVILLVAMKILLPIEDFKYALEYHNKNILVWIATLIISCVVVEIMDSILIGIGNSMLAKVDYYSQGLFIEKFNIFMMGLEGVSVDIIVTVAMYLLGFKVFNMIKNNSQVSLSECFISLKSNISSVGIVILVAEIVSFFQGFILGSGGVLNSLVGVIIIFLWMALVAVISYLSVENTYNI